MSLFRRLVPFALVMSPLVLPSCSVAPSTVHLVAGAPDVPAGLVDSFIAPVPNPTSIARLPDGRTLVGSQAGSLYVIGADGVKNAAPALTFGDICSNSERGLLGVAVDPSFVSNGFVYVYATRDTGAGCKNRVSRFTVVGETADVGTEFSLIANIASTAGNHNGGDIHVGHDGLLYVSVGDGGCFSDGSQCAADNGKARLSNVMSGKILRVGLDGSIPSGNMFPSGVRCNVNGDTTVGQSCAEIYATGLRNPFRLIPDNNISTTRFLINDVGQDKQEEVDELKAGADYGWNVREGLCATGVLQPCNTTPPSGITNPLYAYNHFNLPNGGAECGAITGGVLPPAGWTGKAGSSYLYADFGCNQIFEVSGLGTTNTVTTFATGVGTVVDMVMVEETAGWAMYYTTFANGGELHRVRSATAVDLPGKGRLVPITPRRILDTRENLGASVGKPRAQSVTAVHLPAAVVPPEATAVSVNLTGSAPTGSGFVTAWPSGFGKPRSSNLNFAYAGETSANAAVLPVGPGSDINLFTDIGVHLIVDVTGYWLPAKSASDGRFTPTDPSRILDTRSGLGALASGPLAAGGRVDLQVAGRGDVPADGASAVALVVTTVNPATAGFVTVWPTDKSMPQASSLNPMGNDVRANLVIVPLSAGGAVSLFASSATNVLVDVAGWFTDTSASSSTVGLLQTIRPTRVLDTRDTKTRWAAGETRLAPIATSAKPAGTFVYNLTATNTGGWGFLTAFSPDKSLPIASNVNFEQAGQSRAALAISQGKALAAGGAPLANIYSYAATDIIVDATAYFTS